MLLVRNVDFSFADQPVLQGISLHCDRGETIGVVGRSGSGKTTLLNLIAGYFPRQAGVISVDGIVPDKAAREQKIGYVFQTPTLMPWLTVRQNVALPLRLRCPYRAEAQLRAKVDTAMESSHISHAADKFPHELSGGMRTRASIARAIVYHPVLLLADEPFAALDDVVKESVYRDLEQITAARRTATILVTHNLVEATLLCDRVYVLGAERDTAPSRIVHCEEIGLPRPRALELLGSPRFLTARNELRKALG